MELSCLLLPGSQNLELSCLLLPGSQNWDLSCLLGTTWEPKLGALLSASTWKPKPRGLLSVTGRSKAPSPGIVSMDSVKCSLHPIANKIKVGSVEKFLSQYFQSILKLHFSIQGQILRKKPKCLARKIWIQNTLLYRDCLHALAAAVPARLP